MNFLMTRTCAMGDNDKQVNIFYPAGNYRLETLFSFIKSYYSKESKILNLIGVKEHQNILDLSKNHYIRTFKTGHTFDSLGYSLIEKRKKLKPEFVGQNIPKILLENPGIEISEEKIAILFSYAVDAINVDINDIKDSKVLFIDSTFLKGEDRDGNTHYTLDEAYDLALNSKCENVVFMHLSKRYSWAQFASYIENKKNHKEDFKSVSIINFNRPQHLSF